MRRALMSGVAMVCAAGFAGCQDKSSNTGPGIVGDQHTDKGLLLLQQDKPVPQKKTILDLFKPGPSAVTPGSPVQKGSGFKPGSPLKSGNGLKPFQPTPSPVKPFKPGPSVTRVPPTPPQPGKPRAVPKPPLPPKPLDPPKTIIEKK